MTRVAIILCVALLGACGPRVKPISLHDQSIPVDSRRFIADTQDALSIARASRDEAQRELDTVREWRRDVVRGVDWPQVAEPAIRKLDELASARVELAEMELRAADLAVELAEAKVELTTAEMAVRHDIASYDLESFRQRTDQVREARAALTDEILTKRDAIDALTSEWWQAYSSWANKGDTRLYYVPFIDAEAPTAPVKRKVEEEEEEQPAEEAEEATGQEAPEKETEEGEDLRIW